MDSIPHIKLEPVEARRLIVFDLDDTLFREADFVESGHRELARQLHARYGIPPSASLGVMASPKGPGNALDALRRFIEAMEGPDAPESIKWMVETIRTHKPDISLAPDVADALERLAADTGNVLALVTQGRLVTQLNKIEALGVARLLTIPPHLCENPKPGEDPGATKDNMFRFLDRLVKAPVKISVGDNPRKDFRQPNAMGWVTVCVADDGRNIHPQRLEVCDTLDCPDYLIDSVGLLPHILPEIDTKFGTPMQLL